MKCSNESVVDRIHEERGSGVRSNQLKIMPVDVFPNCAVVFVNQFSASVSLTPQPPLPKIRVTFDKMANRRRSEFSGEGEPVFPGVFNFKRRREGDRCATEQRLVQKRRREGDRAIGR